MKTVFSKNQATTKEDLKAWTMLLLHHEELRLRDLEGARASEVGMDPQQLFDRVRFLSSLSEEDLASPSASRSNRLKAATRFDALLRESMDELVEEKLIKIKEHTYGSPEYQTSLAGRAFIADNFLSSFAALPQLPPKENRFQEILRVDPTVPKHNEKSIAPIALLLIAQYNLEKGTPMPTRDLRLLLKQKLVLGPEDLGKLKDRKDNAIDQVIRNLISHNTLIKNDHCSRNENGDLRILRKGKVEIAGTFVRRMMAGLGPSLPKPDQPTQKIENNKVSTLSP